MSRLWHRLLCALGRHELVPFYDSDEALAAEVLPELTPGPIGFGRAFRAFAMMACLVVRRRCKHCDWDSFELWGPP